MIKNVSWRHAVVFLLLGIALFDPTVVDMIAPQRCNDGSDAIAEAVPLKNAAGRPDQNAPVKAAISDQGLLPQQDPHSDSSPASTEEDCFYCCSHALPGCPVNPEPLNTEPRIDIALIEFLPLPPPTVDTHVLSDSCADGDCLVKSSVASALPEGSFLSPGFDDGVIQHPPVFRADLISGRSERRFCFLSSLDPPFNRLCVLRI